MAEYAIPQFASRNELFAMVSGGSSLRDAQLVKLATLCGFTAIIMNEDRYADCLLVDLYSETERLTDSLSRITHYLQRYRSTALIWSKMESLEEVYAALPHSQCHFLVNADDVEAVPILAGAYGRGSMDRLHDKDRDVEFGSLHRISDELAEFARTLARMAEPDGEGKVSDSPVSFRPAPMAGFQGFP